MTDPPVGPRSGGSEPPGPDANHIESLYERAPCGLLSYRPDGMILTANTTFLELTGYRAGDLLNRRTFPELLSVGGRIYHETHYAPMLRMHGSAREIALEIVCADGTRLPVLANSVLDLDERDEPVVVRTAIFPARERREYEQELVRAKQRAEESEQHAQVLARTLQQTLIPPVLPEVPGLDLAAVYHPEGPGHVIGGDFYDVFEIGAGDWAVVIGDVCGKGPQAAVVTALARHAIRGATVRHPDPADALDVLNTALLRAHTERFCTVCLIRLRQQPDATWGATIASGGHPLPILHEPGHPPREIGRHGTLLGVVDPVSIQTVEAVIQPGMSLVLYTDGVTEARNALGLYGERRLFDAVTRHAGTAHNLASGILDEVLTYQDGHARDDTAILVARLPGPKV